MNKKLSVIILLYFIIINNSFGVSTCKPDDEGWKFTAKATGKTTGHIGDLAITNQSVQTQSISLDAYLIPPKNGKQGYAVYEESIQKITIKAGETYTHPLKGYCVNVKLPPPNAGEPFPEFSKWFSAKNIDIDYVNVWHKDETPTHLNFTSQFNQAASVLLDAVKNLDTQYNTWKKPLQIPDLYPGDDLVTKEAIIQQTIWQFASALQGKIYSFEQFEQSILQQPRVKQWMNLRGIQSSTINHYSIRNSTYFNYQCQKLWYIFNELNTYINIGSRQLISQRTMNIENLQVKDIQFQDVWANVNLAGLDFKVNEPLTITDINTKKPKSKTKFEKYWPYGAVGAGLVTGVTGIIILTNDKDDDDDDNESEIEGCMDETACNFDEAAEKQGECLYEDCFGVCGGGNIFGTLCNGGNGVFTEECACREFDCSLNLGTIKFCDQDATVKLIDLNGVLFEVEFSESVQEEFVCNTTNLTLQDGQIIKFDYYELDEAPKCDTIINKKIMLTCLELVNKEGLCNLKNGSVSKSYQVCNEADEELVILMKTDSTYFIIPQAFECSEIFQQLEAMVDTSGNNIIDIKLDYEAFNYDRTCNATWVVLTCLEIDTGVLKQTPNSYYNEGFTPIIENRLVTTAIQHSEFSDAEVLTNILGVQYNQPITPALFIENQSALGYLPQADLYLLNNKLTLNAKNPYLPIHYGMGFNSLQLTEIPNLSNWQNELIWNVGMKVPVFKIFQLEADVFKSFEVEDPLNFTFRVVYKKGRDKTFSD